jgi:hypothetical protein
MTLNLAFLRSCGRAKTFFAMLLTWEESRPEGRLQAGMPAPQDGDTGIERGFCGLGEKKGQPTFRVPETICDSMSS